MNRFDQPLPPKWAQVLLRNFIKPEYLEEILGDMEEVFQDDLEQYSLPKARWLYTWGALKLLRPGLLKQLKVSYHHNTYDMFKNYFTISLRHFAKNKSYSLINLSGLVLGLTSCLLIGLYILQELSYDRFHPAPGRTYRIVMDMYNDQELSARSAVIFPAVGPTLQETIPEVKSFTRILPFGNGVFSRKVEGQPMVRYNETKAVIADERFFKQFGFRLLQGDPQLVLAEKNQVVLSESTARKYFGDQNPIGETLTRRGAQELTVSGIMEDFPENSHMDFDLIISLKTSDEFESLVENWGWYDFYTFVELEPTASIDQFNAKLAALLDEKKANQFRENNSREVLWSQPIEDIHLYSDDMSWDMGQNGGAYQVYFLGAVALLILIIAWVNFINLSTARAVKRAKEVGIRKVVGAVKHQLRGQFLTEALLYNVFGVLISVLLVFLLLRPINHVFDLSLKMQYLIRPEILLGLAGLIGLGTLVSGLYPAVLLSSFQPLQVLKSRFYQRKRSFGFRQVMVVFQFAASTVLILGTFIVMKQLKYMQRYDLGINMQQTLVLRAPTSSGEGSLTDRLGLFKENLQQIPAVKGMTLSSSMPGIENFSITDFTTKYLPNSSRSCYRISIDEQFIPEFEIGVVSGRNFMREMLSDSSAILINEQAVSQLGFPSAEEAVGEKIFPGTRHEMTIVGVVEDYHQASVKEALDPVVFYYQPDRGNYYSIKIETGKIQETVSVLENQWNEIYPDNPFDYFFLDESFARQYESDQRFNSIFVGFASLAIFVACLGLFGLISYTVEQNRREIGIRKVMGASAQQIISYLTGDYLKLIIVAMLIAFPLAYYLMSQWLQAFAYRTSIGAGMFVAGALVVVLVAVLTVSGKSYRAAIANPVRALREE